MHIFSLIFWNKTQNIVLVFAIEFYFLFSNFKSFSFYENKKIGGILKRSFIMKIKVGFFKVANLFVPNNLQ